MGFGDVCGFGNWAHRSSTSSEEFKRFILSAHDLYIELRRKGYFVKLLADGVMFVKELDNDAKSKEICVNSLCDTSILTDRIQGLINRIPHPRPTGFRIRMVKGDVWKLKSSPAYEERVEVDYVGYTVNLAFRLLSYQKNTPLICHESLKEFVNGKFFQSTSLMFKKINNTVSHVSGIDDEDLDDLWEYTCLGKEKECSFKHCEKNLKHSCLKSLIDSNGPVIKNQKRNL